MHAGSHQRARKVSLRQPNADFSGQQSLSDSSLSSHSLWFPLSSLSLTAQPFVIKEIMAVQLRLALGSEMSRRQHQNRWAQQAQPCRLAQPPAPHATEIVLTPGPVLTDATEMLGQRKNRSENK